MADIFDEVSEDLRQDQMLQIWKKYGKFIIGFIILLTVFFLDGIKKNKIENKIENKNLIINFTKKQFNE